MNGTTVPYETAPFGGGRLWCWALAPGDGPVELVRWLPARCLVRFIFATDGAPGGVSLGLLVRSPDGESGREASQFEGGDRDAAPQPQPGKAGGARLREACFLVDRPGAGLALLELRRSGGSASCAVVHARVEDFPRA